MTKSETYPHVATITGSFAYSVNGKLEDSIPVSVTIGDSCCEGHAASAAVSMLIAEAVRRQVEESEYVVVFIEETA